jgi:hypothetical protein
VKTEGGWRKGQSGAFRCNWLQLAATRCNWLQQGATKRFKKHKICDLVRLAASGRDLVRLGEIAATGCNLLQLAPQESSKNNLCILTCAFGGWRRRSLVTDRVGYAPRLLLASRQNPGVIIANPIF